MNENILDEKISLAGGDSSLSKAAAAGDRKAQSAVIAIADPLIRAQTYILCKKFCMDLYLHHECSIPSHLQKRDKDLPLCDWGNGSYAWMLEDLCGPKRLKKFEGNNGATLKTYFFAIIGSVPFYERWKDWRFGRRINVPDYIKEISPVAGRCFLMLCDQNSLLTISQTIKQPLEKIEQTVDSIILVLTKRGKLHLLNRGREISLTSRKEKDEYNEAVQTDIPDSSWEPEKEEFKKILKKGWNRLSAVEQMVLDALVIQEAKGEDLLGELRILGISIKKGTPASETKIQQLYYFKRVTLAKLSKFCGLN